ncbi:PAS domain-containing sensor histidine kinase [Flavitalea antarctica]
MSDQHLKPGHSSQNANETVHVPSSQRYKTITDEVPQLIWENEPGGKAISFNKRWFEFCGRTYEQSYGRGWIDLAHPEDGAVVERWRKDLRDGKVFEGEVRLRRHDGRYIWHLLRNIPVKDNNGKVLGWVGTATDVQELKNSSAMLNEVSVRLRAVLETAIDFAIITLDGEGNVIDWNSGAEEMFGYTRQEVLGRYCDFFFTPEDVYGGIPQLELKKARETGQAIDERWHLKKNGERFFLSGVMKPMAVDNVTGFVKVARDITDRKLTEEVLLLSEQQRSLAMQSAEMGEWTYYIPEDVIEVKERCRVVMGMNRQEERISPEAVLQLIHEDDRNSVVEAMKDAIGGLHIFHAEFRVRFPETRSIAWVNAYGRVTGHQDQSPSKMIGVVYDITPRKLLEKQKDDFISIASHELKSPVTSIKAYSELLDDVFRESGDSNNALLVKKLNAQVDRMVKLIYNLLDSSTISQLKMKLNPEPVDINVLIEECLSGFELSASRDRLTFLPDKIPLLQADPHRIRQVIENMVSNALKYSPTDKQVIISTKDNLDSALVSVQDFGNGVPEEMQSLIFERYYRVHDEKLESSQGLGLGLYISSEIIRHHFGTISVDSTVGEGSTFHFTLPYT